MISPSVRRKLRKRLLKELLDKIRKGEINSKAPLLDDVYSLTKTPRETRPYVSPTDESSYNTSGYMTIGELGAGTPNVWE